MTGRVMTRKAKAVLWGVVAILLTLISWGMWAWLTPATSVHYMKYYVVCTLLLAATYCMFVHSLIEWFILPEDEHESAIERRP